ncbi:hypothetical protein KKB55_19400, partial [Myxococcota bacterium]|nr:hypothetical protein [Myxococcota bacterium]
VCERGACVEAPECVADGDCAARQACQGGACVDLPCELDSHCANDEVCRDGACVPPPECEVDGECGGQRCVAYQCVDCAEDAHCAGGLVCDQNACVPCQSDVRCPGALICEASRCVEPLCDADADCGAQICRGGRCVACQGDTDCAGALICEAGACATPACQVDGDCAELEQCEAGRCVPSVTPCVDEGDCAPEEYCVLGTCRSGGSCDLTVYAPELGRYQIDTSGRPDDLDGRCGSGGPEQVVGFGGRPMILALTTLGSEVDTLLSVRQTCEDSASELSCNDDVYDEVYESWLTMKTEADTLYYAIVERYGAASGVMNLSLIGAEIPEQCSQVYFNPSFSDNIIYENATTATGNTNNYSNRLSPSCNGSSNAPEDMFAFISPINIHITAYTENASFDTVIYVLGEDCQTEVTCNDDGVAGLNGRVSFNADAAKVYYIVVDGYGSQSGDFELVVEPTIN